MTAAVVFRKAANRPPGATANPLAGYALPGDEATLRQLVAQAVARLQTSVAGVDVANTLGLGDVAAAVDGLDWDGWTAVLNQAQELWSKQIANGALGSIAEVAPGLLVLVDHAFPAAVALAERENASMVSALTDTTRSALVQALGDALRSGKSVEELSATLEGFVGLNARQDAALARYQTLQRARGLTGGQLANAASRYRDALLADRANAIAITELSRAANMGRYQGYLLAAARGSIDPATVQKAVIVAPGCCSYCSAMQIGEGLDGSFDPNDPSVLYPPFHPRCRCSFRIIQVGEPGYQT